MEQSHMEQTLLKKEKEIDKKTRRRTGINKKDELILA
jgi:hypothetical protein